MKRSEARRHQAKRGQAIVELAMTFPMVVAIILLVVELGFAFNAYTALTSAARHGAKAGAIYLFDPTVSPDPSVALAANKQNRESGTGAVATPYLDNVRDTTAWSLGWLNKPGSFDKNTDITITYSPLVASNDTQKGDLISVKVQYRYRPVTGFFSNAVIPMTSEATDRIE